MNFAVKQYIGVPPEVVIRDFIINKYLSDSPYIVQPLSFSLNNLTFSMELFMGDITQGTFSMKEKWRMTKDILKGLFHIHCKNMYHGDLNPKNILFKRDKGELRIVLCDFGNTFPLGFGTSGRCTKLFSPLDTKLGIPLDIYSFGKTLLHIWSDGGDIKRYGNKEGGNREWKNENRKYLSLDFIPKKIEDCIKLCLNVNANHRPTSKWLLQFFGIKINIEEMANKYRKDNICYMGGEELEYIHRVISRGRCVILPEETEKLEKIACLDETYFPKI